MSDTVMGRHIFLSLFLHRMSYSATGQQSRSIFVKSPYTNGAQ